MEQQYTTEIFREENGNTATFRLTGTFDARAAVRLRKLLEEADAPRLVIDFSRVRQFVDVAVAVLSGGLKSRSVELRGLGRHQESVFRYFDIPVARDPDHRYYQPEEALAL
ncbi:MAG TPA: STAS domain-containing protein [Myxococcales bacterium]|jgi:anti-anti-sigma regulatory factor|nr:STAS domain-containing protein [Myxococcales bacterium]